MYDLIIIGGGPAGITAGIYAGRQRLKTLLITKDFGGQMAKKAVNIENYPGFETISGQDLIKKFVSHLNKFKIEVLKDEVIKLEKGFTVYTLKKKFKAKAVIVTTGVDPRPLEVPGEEEFIGKGVSYCSVCDAVFFDGKNVAVIGGGNSAFESASFLKHYIKKMYILEHSSEIKADKINQELVGKSDKVEIITNASLKEIKGDKFVKSITYQDLKTKEIKSLDVSGVFVEIGYQPATSFVKGLVDFNERDEIKVEYETQATKTPGLYAAGDVNRGKCKQIVAAAGEGAKAAIAVHNYIKKNE